MKIKKAVVIDLPVKVLELKRMGTIQDKEAGKMLCMACGKEHGERPWGIAVVMDDGLRDHCVRLCADCCDEAKKELNEVLYGTGEPTIRGLFREGDGK